MVKQNIICNIQELPRKDNVTNLETFMRDILNTIDSTTLIHIDVNDFDIDDMIHSLSIEYSTNYTVNEITRIIEYYGLSKNKLRKNEKIQLLIMYEIDPDNHDIVERRKRLWKNIEELQLDPYLNKFISF